MTLQNKRIHQIIALFLFIVIILNPFDIISLPNNQVFAVAITLFISYLWITEAVALPVASLFLVVLIPLTGIMPIKDTLEAFANPIIFLFLGGFIFGLVFEKWHFHKRLALHIINKVGFSPKRIILAFMVSTCFLSMWISNTATTIIMLPIALSIISLIEQVNTNSIKEMRDFSKALVISLAFGSNIGGYATLIGSPPNALLSGFLREFHAIDLSFLKWMLIGIPFMLLSFIPAYFGITLAFSFNNLKIEAVKMSLQEEIKTMGRLKQPEICIIVVGIITITLLIVKDWVNSLINYEALSDTLILIAAALIFFLIPVKHEKNKFMLQWSDTEKMSWGVLYLFGGALCLANMLQETGIINSLGELFIGVSSLPSYFVLGLLLIMILIITEFISGTAICSVFIPTVFTIAASLNIDLLYIAVPVTLAANVAYLTPIGTAPNAIILSKGNITTIDIARAGLLIKVVSFILLQFFVTWWIRVIL